MSEVDEAIFRLKKIQTGFKQKLANLHEQLDIFDSEPEMYGLLENSKKDADSRASNLEAEVKQLCKELEDIKELLSFKFEKNIPFNS